MKNYLKLAILIICVSVLLVTMNYCRKIDSGDLSKGNQIDCESLIESSKTVQNHILEFKARMEYYRDNPGLKSGGQLYTADTAIQELKSLMNFNYCYTNIITDKKDISIDSIIMPLDELNKISDPKLMLVYYNEVIEVVRSQMLALEGYKDMKLLLVDIEQIGTNSNGDAIVSIVSLVGNQVSNSLHDDSWWYGEEYGICNGTNIGFDAAIVLDQRITEGMIPDPPVGCRWVFIPYMSTDYLIPTDYRVPNPNDPLDNFKDYQIFFAINDPTATNPPLDITYTEQCVSGGEMIFYETEYMAIASGFENQYNKKFYQCEIFGMPYTRNGLPTIEHFYNIYLGTRHLLCDWDPENILD